MSSRVEAARNSFYSAIESSGYIRKSDYVNLTTPVSMFCPKEHETGISPVSFHKGVRCSDCFPSRKELAKRHFETFVVEQGYRLYGEYVNCNEKVDLICPHDHIFAMAPTCFLRGQRCPRCQGHSAQGAQEDFIALATQENYIIRGEYNGAHCPVVMHCPVGHEISISPSNFRNGRRCRKCRNVCPDQAREKFTERAGLEGYTLNGDYITSRQKVSMCCPNGHSWDVSPCEFLRGHRCARCAKNNAQEGERKFRALVDSEGYVITGVYKKTLEKIDLECPNGHTLFVTPSSFSSGNRCAKCSHRCPEQAKQDFEDCVKESGYAMTGWYVNTASKIELVCPKAHTFQMQPAMFKFGQRCPECAKERGISLGEEMALRHLQSNSIAFIHDERGFFLERPRLRPDFVLPGIKTIIEIDGGDHFPGIAGGRMDTALRSNDTYKDQWCLENGWHMVRIPYLNTNVAKTIPGLIDTALAGIRENPKWLFTPIGTDYYERPHPCPRPEASLGSLEAIS